MNNESIELLALSLNNIANAITPMDASGAFDSNGGYIVSHTEAIMSLAKSVEKVAHSISDLALAVSEDYVGASIEEVANAIREFRLTTTNQ